MRALGANGLRYRNAIDKLRVGKAVIRRESPLFLTFQYRLAIGTEIFATLE